jgi:hypothetical protein
MLLLWTRFRSNRRRSRYHPTLELSFTLWSTRCHPTPWSTDSLWPMRRTGLPRRGRIGSAITRPSTGAGRREKLTPSFFPRRTAMTLYVASLTYGPSRLFSVEGPIRALSVDRELVSSFRQTGDPRTPLGRDDAQPQTLDATRLRSTTRQSRTRSIVPCGAGGTRSMAFRMVPVVECQPSVSVGRINYRLRGSPAPRPSAVRPRLNRIAP